MHFHVVTLFPEVCKAYTDASILGRAQKGKGKAKKITVSYYNPRDYTKDKHRKVDDRPYGGGPGMVMYAEPILKAVEKAVGKNKSTRKPKVLIMSPRGTLFDQHYAKKLAKSYKDVVLIAGHYEGIDARVKKILKAEEVSVGPYVLTGGELPALSIIDAVARNIAGVLGKGESLEDTRAASGEMYTRPEMLTYKGKKYRIPKILLTGHHKNIEQWRQKRSLSQDGG
ncbi:tRNA (guanosine(37)-N1)-methyltransferase TrmD [Candidatus Kaiserbacteria bacterium]|nr:tRNA (guanosine(37)-N1)-methyltransferase TrmD [Candidatus Kaiserbacteria bacterium]